MTSDSCLGFAVNGEDTHRIPSSLVAVIPMKSDKIMLYQGYLGKMSLMKERKKERKKESEPK
jgi:hypothetical protein